MNSLQQLQSAFARFLRSGDPAIAAAVASTPQLAAQSRLEIYSSGYKARLREAITKDFPVLRSVIGDEAFTVLCLRYIDAWPSMSFTLRDFGAHLPEFVARAADIANPRFLGELARFEWAFIEAFDAADVPSIGPAAMGDIAGQDWPAVRFEAHPSVQALAIGFNTLQIWDAVKAQQPPMRPVERTESAGALIWRRALTTVFRSTADDELMLWRRLAAGADFATLCAVLADRLPADDVPVRAATLLRGWLAEGLISSLRVQQG